MSRKAEQFASIITNPLNTHNFMCSIPGVDDSISMIIESTTFPTEKFRVITLWFQGEPIHYPGLPENDHTWKFSIPESDNGSIAKIFQDIKNEFWDQKTGILTPGSFKDVEVRARDLNGDIVFHVILHGAWLRGRDAVPLTNRDPQQNWKWDYEWVYTWIEDKLASVEGSSNPFRT